MTHITLRRPRSPAPESDFDWRKILILSCRRRFPRRWKTKKQPKAKAPRKRSAREKRGERLVRGVPNRRRSRDDERWDNRKRRSHRSSSRLKKINRNGFFSRSSRKYRKTLKNGWEKTNVELVPLYWSVLAGGRLTLGLVYRSDRIRRWASPKITGPPPPYSPNAWAELAHFLARVTAVTRVTVV